MPTRRRPLRRNLRRRINDQAIAAWKACDFLALHRALALHPWERSPLPIEVTALGVCEDSVRGGETPWDESCATALALQRELMELAGPPDCRAAYEQNLKEAEQYAAHAQELIDHPERGGHGTGGDPASRQRALDDALVELAWRKELLAALDD
jgi:hypothetical protein